MRAWTKEVSHTTNRMEDHDSENTERTLEALKKSRGCVISMSLVLGKPLRDRFLTAALRWSYVPIILFTIYIRIESTDKRDT